MSFGGEQDERWMLVIMQRTAVFPMSVPDPDVSESEVAEFIGIHLSPRPRLGSDQDSFGAHPLGDTAERFGRLRWQQAKRAPSMTRPERPKREPRSLGLGRRERGVSNDIEDEIQRSPGRGVAYGCAGLHVAGGDLGQHVLTSRPLPGQGRERLHRAPNASAERAPRRDRDELLQAKRHPPGKAIERIVAGLRPGNQRGRL
jgi:hypothetical protein